MTVPMMKAQRSGAQTSQGQLESRTHKNRRIVQEAFVTSAMNSRSEVSMRTLFWLQGMRAGLKSVLTASNPFSETDHTEDLEMIDVSTLILHGDDDQIVRIGASSSRWQS